MFNLQPMSTAFFRIIQAEVFNSLFTLRINNIPKPYRDKSPYNLSERQNFKIHEIWRFVVFNSQGLKNANWKVTSN